MGRKVIIDGKEPSSEQIRKEADFKQVLSASKVNGGGSKNIKWFSVAASALIIIAAGFWFINSDENKKSSETKKDNTILENQESVLANKTNLQVPSEIFIVSPKTAIDIITKNGAIISIPKFAFVEQGIPVKEDSIKLVFTEYSNPISVHLSGINMAYDSAGTKYAFQSGGMFELRAFANNEEISLIDDKQIDISYPALIPDEQLNQYSYNENEKTWDYLAAAPVNTFEEECERKMILFNNEEITETVADKSALKKDINNIEKELDKLKKQTTTEPRQANRDNYRFSLDIDETEFPELAQMKNVEFEVIDPRFSFSFFNKTWDNVKLKKAKRGKYLVQLFEGKKKKEFIVYPVLDDNEFDLAYAAYQNECTVIKTAQDKLEEKQAQYDSWTKTNQEVELVKVKKQKAKGLINSVLNTIESGSLYRSITVDLGIYNFDTPIVLPPAGTGVEAEFIIVRNGQTEDLKHVNLVNLDKNIYYPYVKSEMKDFRFQKRFNNIVLATDRDGNLLVSSADEFSSISKGSMMHTFELEFVEDVAAVMKELKN